MAGKADSFRLSDQYQELKKEVHRYLIRQIEDRNLSIDEWPRERLTEFATDLIRRYVFEKKLAVNASESEMLASDCIDELVGYGPLQDLVDDDTVDDIVVNGAGKVFVERAGRLESEPVRFVDDNHVLRVIQRILAPLGRRIDESTPMVDARLHDGSRVNAIIPPLALDGPCLSIRKFRKSALSAEDLLRLGSITQEILDFLHQAVTSRTNLIVVGGTGSGKTTFLNMLSQWIPAEERVITIEDAAELRLGHEHVVRLETRPPNLEGNRAVTARDLVRNALRMRPDRIVVGEVRGDEVLDMMQAMNTGHDGSMTTIHANSAQDAIHRLQLLAGFAGFNGSDTALLQQLASAVDMLVHVTRLPDGKRRVVSVVEVGEVDREGRLQFTEVFSYDQRNDQHRDLRVAA